MEERMIEEWRSGRVEEWRSGRVEEWKTEEIERVKRCLMFVIEVNLKHKNSPFEGGIGA